MEKVGRSIGGCWTCRARRKKCDETHPACHNCGSLELICAGYGPKPDWMDASTQEKQRAEEFKLAVREFYHRKRLRRVSGIRVSEAGHQEMPPAFSLQTNTINSSHSQSFDLRFRSMTNEITRKVTIDTFDNNPSASYADIVDWSALDSEVFSNKAKQSINSCDSNQNYCENRLQFQPFQNSPRGATRKSTTESETWYSTCLLPDDLTTSEAYLLMHYLDHVFYLQFPFYHPSVADSGRGWLLSLLTQTKPMYHAALGLSALHLQSLKEKSMMVRGNVNYDTLPRYLAPALQGLQQYVMDFRTTHDSSIPKMIEILSCIFMLISIELFKGGTSHWRLHLQAGLSLLPDLIAKICSPSPLPEQTTINLLTGTFIWFDIISCVSISWNPALRDAYECLLTDGKIRLETVMGCENWVIIIILRILKLDHWKRQSRQNGYLSTIELTRRVHQIEEAILKGRQYNSSALDEPGFDPALFGVNPGSVEFVTSIFASSVQIYLHLVVSGRRAKLPEIHQSVNDTICYFKKLPSIKLVGSLAWPFYVAACMALGEQRDFFRDLATSADMDWCLLGSIWRAFQVAEKCWKIWDTETGELDCVAAMQSMWIQILLA